MRVRFSDSEQWSSPVKPPRSQNYVKPHDARTRVPNSCDNETGGKFDCIVRVFRDVPPPASLSCRVANQACTSFRINGNAGLTSDFEPDLVDEDRWGATSTSA
jgi:hypothetical protein